jgi:hypothetical protein
MKTKTPRARGSRPVGTPARVTSDQAEARPRRRRLDPALAAEMVAWWKGGMVQREIAQRLNAEGRSYRDGKPWSPSAVAWVLSHHMPPEQRKAVARASHQRERERASRQDPALIAEMIARRKEGMFYRQIAQRLKDEGRLNTRGESWSAEAVARVLRRRLPPEQRKAMARAARRRNVRRRDPALVAEIIALWMGGMTKTEIAARLNGEGRSNAWGGPWSAALVSLVVRRSATPEQLDLGGAAYRQRRSELIRKAARREESREQKRRAFPHAMKLYRKGLSPGQIAERLNADERHGQGRAWNAHAVRDMLRRYADPSEYGALAARHRALAGSERPETIHVRRHDRRIIELKRKGLTLAQIGAQLAREGRTNSEGKPLSQSQISKRIIALEGGTSSPKSAPALLRLIEARGKRLVIIRGVGRFEVSPNQLAVFRLMRDAGCLTGKKLTTRQLRQLGPDYGVADPLRELRFMKRVAGLGSFLTFPGKGRPGRPGEGRGGYGFAVA